MISCGAEREQLRALYLDSKNKLIHEEKLHEGTVNETAIYPREVMKRALDRNATAVILVHNHPSGDPTPSRADIALTREVAAAAKALGIALHDHIIIGRGIHTSLRALGHL